MINESSSSTPIQEKLYRLRHPERHAKLSVEKWESRIREIMAIMNEQNLKDEIKAEEMANFREEVERWEGESLDYLLNSEFVKWWNMSERSKLNKGFKEHSRQVVTKGKTTSKVAVERAIKHRFDCFSLHRERNPDGSCKQCSPSKVVSTTAQQLSTDSNAQSPTTINAGIHVQNGDFNFGAPSDARSSSLGPGIQHLLDRTYSHGATHDSNECDLPTNDLRFYMPTIRDIMLWIPEGLGLHPQGTIRWLHGTDNIAKSDLAHYVASFCREAKIRCASFFFSEKDDQRNTTKNLITTIAYQIAKRIPDLEEKLDLAIQDDPTRLGKHLKFQQKDLMVTPLLETECQRRIKRPVVIVLDGVDQCIRPKDMEEVLDFVSVLSELPPVRIVLTTGTQTRSDRAFTGESMKSRTIYHPVELSSR